MYFLKLACTRIFQGVCHVLASKGVCHPSFLCIALFSYDFFFFLNDELTVIFLPFIKNICLSDKVKKLSKI